MVANGRGSKAKTRAKTGSKTKPRRTTEDKARELASETINVYKPNGKLKFSG